MEAPEVETVSPPADAAAARSEILQPGAVVCSDYEIVRLVAAGVEGEVYETKHQLTGQPAMVKALPAPEFGNTQADERLKGEARALAKLDHPNLLTLYNFRQEGARYFAVLQIPEGQPLEGIVEAEGPLPLDRFHRIFRQVLDGLAYAHQAGLPHGRITALNVAVDEEDRVKITGFDHFVKSDAGGQRSLAAIRYMAPEQIRNHLADERTDLYAVGVLAYFALSGKVPLDGQSEFDIMRAHLEEAPADLRGVRPEIPGPLWQLLEQALSKKAGGRAPSAQAMLDALKTCEAALGDAPPPTAARTSETATAAAGSVSSTAAVAPGRQAGAEGSRRQSDTKEMFPPTAPMPTAEPAPARRSAPASEPEPAPGAVLAQIKPVKKAVPKEQPAVSAAPAPVKPAPVPVEASPKVVVELEPAPPASGAQSPSPLVVPPLTARAPVEPPKPAEPRSVEAPTAPAVPQLPDDDEVASATGAGPEITPAPPPVTPAPPPVEPAPGAASPVSSPKVEVAPEALEKAPVKVVVSPEAVAEPEPAAQPEAEAAEATEAKKESQPQRATDSARFRKIDSHPGTRSDPLQTTPFGGLRIQDGGETEFFSTEQEFDDAHDDFSDLDDFHPKAQRIRRLFIGLFVVLVLLAAGAYFAIFRINPYARGENTQGTKRTEVHDKALLDQVYKEDPELSGTGAGMASMRPAGMRPAGMRPAGMRPAGMVPDAMTPVMTPDAMTPDAMTPDAMTPDAMTPASGGGEAGKLAAEAEKEYKRNRIKAEKLAEQALKLNPAEPTARKVLAKILGAKAKRFLHSGANKGAVSMATRATSLDGSIPGPWFYLGVAKNEMGKKAEAKAALTRYIQLCPKCGYNASYAKQILRSIK